MSPAKATTSPSKEQAEEEAKEPALKRKKVDEEEEKVPNKEDDGEFAPEGDSGSDSFDEDFGSCDGEDEPPCDDEFDVEAYLKWRKDHPDEEGPDPNGELPGDDSEEGEDEDEESDL